MNASIQYKNEEGDNFELDDADISDGQNSEDGKCDKVRLAARFVVTATVF